MRELKIICHRNTLFPSQLIMDMTSLDVYFHAQGSGRPVGSFNQVGDRLNREWSDVNHFMQTGAGHARYFGGSKLIRMKKVQTENIGNIWS